MTDQQQAQDASTDVEAQDAETQDEAQESQPTGFDALPKETQDEIRALRRENAKYRKTVKEYEDSQKSDLERLTGERDEFKTEYERVMSELRDLKTQGVFTDAAARANARAPKTLYRAYRDQLQYDDDGNVTNLDEVIAAAKQDEPDLFKPSTGHSDAGRPGDSTGDKPTINSFFRQLAGKE